MKVLGRRPRSAETVRRIIREKSIPNPAGCWVWQGYVINTGYGKMTWAPDGVWIRGAHRVSYWAHVGPIPQGLVIDHLCRNRLCVNPRHMEVVTQRENTMRSPIAIGALNAAKTHCPQGHAYSTENTGMLYRPGATARYCKTCRRNYAQNKKVSV